MSIYREQFMDQERRRQAKETNVYGEVRQHLHFDGVDRMILGIGDCRTGTTAWLAAAARAGFPAYYQIGKGALRCIQNTEIDLNSGDKLYVPEHVSFGQRGNVVVAKETIGPQNSTECTYNALRSYLHNDYDNKGLDPSQLHVVFFARNPVATYHSWKQAIGEGSPIHPMDSKTMEGHFLLAALTEKAILKQLREDNISHTVFAQELLVPPPGVSQADHSAYILSTIFDQAGAPLATDQAMHAVTNCQEGANTINQYPGLTFFKNNIKFAHEPPYNWDGAIAPTLKGDSYKAMPQQVSLNSLNDSERRFFQTTEIFDTYYYDLLPQSIDQLGLEEFETFYFPSNN